MPTCSNCGSIVMEGDPYCSHCGAHFKWNHAGEVEDASQETRASQSLYDVAEESHDDDFVPGSYDEPDDFLDYGEVSETCMCNITPKAAAESQNQAIHESQGLQRILYPKGIGL